MASKISDERLRVSYRRATTDLTRIDKRVDKARETLTNLDATRAAAQAVIDNADADRAEATAQLEHLRVIARNRGLDLDAEHAAQQYNTAVQHGTDPTIETPAAAAPTAVGV